MNRSHLFRTLSLSFASLVVSGASLAGTASDDDLRAAQSLASTDALVATHLQAWSDMRDVALLAQADGLITNDMRADAQQYAVAMLVEADGLISAQLNERVGMQIVSRIAAADGLVVDSYEATTSTPESQPATRNPGAVLVAKAR